MSGWNDRYDVDGMPPALEPGFFDGHFIPPPPGATQGGQPSFNPFPGATQASSAAWPAPPPNWAMDAPAWAQQQQQPAPPTSAQSWTYGQQYPPFTPMSGYGAPTPAGSWGATTPGGSWGPPTPASGNLHPGASPWVQHPQQQGHYPPAGQESGLGQPITASPYFGGGGGGGGGFGGFGAGAFAAGGGFGDGGGGGMGGGGGTFGFGKKRSKRKATHDSHQPFGSMHDPLGLDLVRSKSHDAAKYPLHRSLSLGGGGGATMYPHSPYNMGTQGPPSEEYNLRNLARRPRDWRPDYDARPGLASYMPRVIKNRSDITEWHDPIKRTLHPHLAYNPQMRHIYLDLRTNPLAPGSTLDFPSLSREPNSLDLAQLVTQPSAQALRLYHSRLPWYIDIDQTHPNGVTLFDVLGQMWQQLDLQISGKHWYNEEVDDKMRAGITEAWTERCAGDQMESAQGVKRVDWLRGKVIFEGLVKGRNGMWEIKTRKLDRV